jgi:HK97 family phage portal protein
MSRRKRTTELNRAQVTVTPPGGVRITLLNGGLLSDSTGPVHRQSLYQIFYEMYRRHPWVRAAVDKRSQTAVQAGYQLTPEDPEQDIDKNRARDFRAFARRSNFSQLRRQWYRDIDIYSEGWGWVQHTKGGKPWKAHRLHPKFTFPLMVEGVVVGVEYGTGEKKELYPIEHLLHFRDEDPDQDVSGLSKLYSLMETVSQDLYAMRYNLSFFENSAQTGIVFNMRNASKEEADRNRLWLEQNYSGAERAHRPIVLEGDIDIKASVAKHSDMQFVEGRKVHRQEILAVRT